MSAATTRIRRTTLAVPGSSQKMIAKSRTLMVDALFLDLEDSVSPLAKEQARENVIAELLIGGFGERIVSVRINDLSTDWAKSDLTEVMRAAGKNLDCIMLPKVRSAADVQWLANELSKIETEIGKPVG